MRSPHLGFLMSGDQQHSAERFTAFDIRMCSRRVLQWESLVDDDLQFAGRRFIDMPLDHVAHAVGDDFRAQEHTGQRPITLSQVGYIELILFTSGIAHRGYPATITERK